ncbi:hypothetical protein B5F75_04015 [Candidatus Avelusimicrobium gallicola]|uniref:Uncharacterized protein n=2 Tax=Candidatus Avelusimicrobium gallicola TaxID=2562704 RepID=A0A1Y4DH63_9BACT|nr:hypothetical protein B5F75_04015 [Elusimicrobium sp. An273]
MQITKRIYQGNGITRKWDVDFPLLSAADLRIYVTSPQGAEEEISSDFSVDLLTHTLTYPTDESGKAALADGWKLTAVRATPLTQEIDLLRQGELDAEVLEEGYDKLTLLVQELEEKVDRSIKYPVSSQENDLETDNFLANILSAKEAAVLASQEAAHSAQAAQQTASDAQQTITQAQQNFTQETETFSENLQNKEQSIYQAAEGYVAQAAQQAQTAKNWALKTDGPVEGEEFSAKKYAQEAAQAASTAAMINKISNCLTKIPQDIKLSVSSGTLTLGSGSKAYSGSGSVINITQNLTASSSGAGSFLVFAKADASALVLCPLANCSSGTSDPQTENTVYYNTSTKTVSYYASANTPTEVSLPLGVCTASGQITSVDQVFNGFGFIGKTIFVLPGVEGLYPNGRNADGSLNNVSVIVNAVMTYTSSSAGQKEVYLKSNDFSDVGEAAIDYDETQNKNIYTSNGTTASYALVGRAIRTEGGNIVSLMPQNVFRAVDYGDVYKRTTVYSSDGSNATITFPTPIKAKDARYLEVVYTAKGKSYTSVIPSVFAPLGIVVGSLNWGGDQTDRDYDCVMNVTCAGGYITAFTSLGRDIYIKRVDVVDYLARS